MRRPTVIFVFALVAQAASVIVAFAQDSAPTAPPVPPKVLMTPFFALGDDLAPGGGGAFTFALGRQLSVEAEASLGTDAARSSASLLYALPRLGRFALYVAGGGGVQRDEVTDVIELKGFPTRKKTEFAANVGAGGTVPITERLSYRVDFRWYNPRAEWPESWRVFSGITLAVLR